MLSIKEKVAIVTGGGVGIGKSIAETFAGNGAIVHIIDLNNVTGSETAQGINDTGGTAFFHEGDVSAESRVNEIIAQILQRHNRIDILVNNAGIVPTGPIHEATVEEWDRAMAINTRSHFLCSKAVLPAMMEQKDGAIIHIASVAGVIGVKNRGIYTATKGGVIGLMKSIAIDYAPYNIRVNAICPGTIETPSLSDRINASPDPAAARAQFVARHPIPRIGKPEEVAAVALFFASDASTWTTGTCYVIDGGMAL